MLLVSLRLYSYDCNDFKFHTAGRGFRDPNGFFTHLKNALDTLYEEGEEGCPKMMTIGLYCRIIERPGRFKALRDFVEYISDRKKGFRGDEDGDCGGFQGAVPISEGVFGEEGGMI